MRKFAVAAIVLAAFCLCGLAQGGEVFLLDMGEPVRIFDLARRMIHLSGLTVRDDEHPDGDLEIQFTGLRSGEKLREELLIGTNDLPTEHPMIRRAREQSLPWPTVQDCLERLAAASRNFDYPAVREVAAEAAGADVCAAAKDNDPAQV